MLGAYDDLQRAIDHAPKNVDDQPEVKTFIEGIELTQVNLEKVSKNLPKTPFDLFFLF